MESLRSSPKNRFEDIAIHKFAVTIRDVDHFNKITKWLNTNVGRSEKNWAMPGRPLKKIRANKSVIVKVYIMNDNVDERDFLYLNLL